MLETEKAAKSKRSIDELIAIAREITAIFEKHNLTKSEARETGFLLWDHIVPRSDKIIDDED